MSKSQATAFLAHWKLLDQLPNQSSGFSATVFESLDEPGKCAFAVRGTEITKPSDWIADVSGIGGQGIALRQALDLYNYRKSLETGAGQAFQAAYLKIDAIESALLAAYWVVAQLPGAGRDYYKTCKAALENRGYWVEGSNVMTLALGTSNDVLAGTVLAQGRGTSSVRLSAGYDIVGHSLGGHLAIVLGRLDYQRVGSIETFNPPYFDPFTSDRLTENFFQQLKHLEIASSGTSSIEDQFRPSQNYEISGDLVHKIGDTKPGEAKQLYSETEDTNPISAHGITQMVDSLALNALFGRLDPVLNASAAQANLDKITGILKAAATTPENTLETTLDAVRTLLETNRLQGLPDGRAIVTDSNRESLYANLAALDKTLNETLQNTTFTVESTVDKTAAQMAGNATGDVAWRYALYKLNPFALVDQSGLYDAVDLAGELARYDPANGEGGLTDEWIQDRAAMLTWKNRLGVEDAAPTQSDTDGSDAWFDDRINGLSIEVGGTASNEPKWPEATNDEEYETRTERQVA